VQIAIQGLSKNFGPTVVLDNIDLEIGEREFLGLLGPSGSGKTTLLRILAGLEFADGGHVLFDGREAQMLPVEERQVGLVFQHYALFGHMTVFNNVAFGLKVRPRQRRPERQEIAASRATARLGPARRLRGPLPQPALGRSEAARRTRAGPRY